MKILSFDTSTRSIQTCVLDHRDVLHESVLEPTGHERQEAASMLLPEIELALHAASLKKQDIDLIVVGAGPGSFTGVRIAMVTARSLGQGLQLGVIPICFLEVVASAVGKNCTIAMPAGAGQYFAASYELKYLDEGAYSLPNTRVAPFCAPLQDMLQQVQAYPPIVVPKDMQETVPSNPDGWPEINNIATAGAFLAYDRLSLCDSAAQDSREQLSSRYPWQNALPLYLRSPSVTLKAYGNSTKENEPS